MTPDEWDALCDRCAKCCIIKNSSYACRALNVKTKLCTKYATRFDVEMCLPVQPGNVLALHERGILPDSCAYVRHAHKKAPLEEVPEVLMIPYAKAPLSVRRYVTKQRKAWLKALSTYACQSSEDPSTQVSATEVPEEPQR